MYALRSTALRIVAAAAVTLGLALVGSPAGLSFASGKTVLTNCSAPALAAAMKKGGTITFKKDCTFKTSNVLRVAAGKSVTIDGSGHTEVIEPQYVFAKPVWRLFEVDGGRLSLIYIEVEHGRSNGDPGPAGKGPENGSDGTVGKDGTPGGNAAGSDGKPGTAGTDAGIAGRKAGKGGAGLGAGLYIKSGDVTLTGVTFSDDVAYGGIGGNGWACKDGSYSCGSGGAGGDGGNGGTGLPGGNGAPGKPGGDATLSKYKGADGGAAQGGAIYNDGSLTITNCVFTDNFANGGSGGSGSGYEGNGSGGDGGIGGAGGMKSGLGGNGGSGAKGGKAAAGSDGADGGEGSGGAIYSSGKLTISNTSFKSNAAYAGFGGGGGYGGPGGNGGDGSPGGLGGDNNINSTYIAGGNGAKGADGADGGDGGNGGSGANADGGAIYSSGDLSLHNDSFSKNVAIAGNGAYGGNGGPGGTGGSGGYGGYDTTGKKRKGGNGGDGADGGGGGGGGDVGDGGSSTGGAVFSFKKPSVLSGLTFSGNKVGAGSGGASKCSIGGVACPGQGATGGSAGLGAKGGASATNGTDGSDGSDGDPGKKGKGGSAAFANIYVPKK